VRALECLRSFSKFIFFVFGSIPVLMIIGCATMRPAVPCVTNPTIVIDCTTPAQVSTCVCPNNDIVWVEKLTSGPTPTPTPIEFLIKFKKDTPIRINGIPLREIPSTGGRTSPTKANASTTQIDYEYGFVCSNQKYIDPMVKIPPAGATQCN
jgi:hypothetical protein